MLSGDDSLRNRPERGLQQEKRYSEPPLVEAHGNTGLQKRVTRVRQRPPPPPGELRHEAPHVPGLSRGPYAPKSPAFPVAPHLPGPAGWDVGAAASRAEAASGHFRCGEGLRGLSGQQTPRPNSMPSNPLLCVLHGEKETSIQPEAARSRGKARSEPPFCNSNLPLTTNSKKGRKETPASGCWASASELRATAPLPAGRLGSHSACARLLVPGRGEEHEISRMCTQTGWTGAARGAGEPGARWSRVSRRPPWKRFACLSLRSLAASLERARASRSPRSAASAAAVRPHERSTCRRVSCRERRAELTGRKQRDQWRVLTWVLVGTRGFIF
ncbi:uncharacterized protein LOC115072330 [Nannospalax galili]|uniref:uncharacterized protein LOC115072330 n=1 Tax=Nannospalax galili TaxID=1026970 RepID=UPI00111C50D4|nr:uncharacterized protein LOC115072330 [Nannospalax galili]